MFKAFTDVNIYFYWSDWTIDYFHFYDSFPDSSEILSSLGNISHLLLIFWSFFHQPLHLPVSLREWKCSSIYFGCIFIDFVSYALTASSISYTSFSLHVRLLFFPSQNKEGNFSALAIISFFFYFFFFYYYYYYFFFVFFLFICF